MKRFSKIVSANDRGALVRRNRCHELGLHVGGKRPIGRGSQAHGSESFRAPSKRIESRPEMISQTGIHQFVDDDVRDRHWKYGVSRISPPHTAAAQR